MEKTNKKIDEIVSDFEKIGGAFALDMRRLFTEVAEMAYQESQRNTINASSKVFCKTVCGGNNKDCSTCTLIKTFTDKINNKL